MGRRESSEEHNSGHGEGKTEFWSTTPAIGGETEIEERFLTSRTPFGMTTFHFWD
jgi:hypothetical protein